jgi:hypothetical protein
MQRLYEIIGFSRPYLKYGISVLFDTILILNKDLFTHKKLEAIQIV